MEMPKIHIDIWLTRNVKYNPIAISSGSQVPIEMTIRDMPQGAIKRADAFATAQYSGKTYINSPPPEIDGNTVTIIPLPGLFVLGWNELQVELYDENDTPLIPFTIPVDCRKRVSDAGDPATPEEVRPLVGRAEAAAADSAASANRAQQVRDSIQEEVGPLVERAEAAAAESEASANRVQQVYATPQMFGGQGNGSHDDTQAIALALAASDTVVLPDGTYLVTDKIIVARGKKLCGCGNTILNCTSETDLFWISQNCEISDIKIVVSSSRVTGCLFRISDKTLTDCAFRYTSAIGIKIHDIDIEWITATQDPNAFQQASTFIIALAERFGADSTYSGFYGVNIWNVHDYSRPALNVGYFLKAYLESSEGLWITGCTISDCIIYGKRWGLFLNKDDTDFATSSSGEISGWTLRNVQHQATANANAFAYLHKSPWLSFQNCIPWDWQSSSDAYSYAPYAIHSSVLTGSSYQRISSENTLAINPLPNITRIGTVADDGTHVRFEGQEAYLIYASTGLPYVDPTFIPKSMAFRSGVAMAVWKAEKSKMKTPFERTLSGNSMFVIFGLYISGTYYDVCVDVGTATPSAIVSRALPTRIKLAYHKTETDFTLYISSSTKNEVAMILSKALPDSGHYYSQVNMTNYYHTANTFGIEKSSLYLDALPDSATVITEVSTENYSDCKYFAITEDMVTVTTADTKGVAPYNTSYGMTYIEIKKDAGIRWVEGGLYAFVVDTKLVVKSANRNAAVRIGGENDGDVWHPLFGTSAIATSSNFLIKAYNTVWQYKTVYHSDGALHVQTDSNTTYAYLVNTIAGDSTDSPIHIDSNGYGAKYGLAFPTTPLSDVNGIVTEEKWSTLVRSSSTSTTKEAATPVSGKFYIDRHPIYIHSANIAKGGVAVNPVHQDYTGYDCRYTVNTSATYMSPYRKAFLWLKNFDPEDMSFESDATVGNIMTLDKIGTRFPTTVAGSIYLYFLGWTGTNCYTVTPAFTQSTKIYKHTPSTKKFEVCQIVAG